MTCYIDLKILSSVYHSGYNVYSALCMFERQRSRSRALIFILPIQTCTCSFVSECHGRTYTNFRKLMVMFISVTRYSSCGTASSHFIVLNYWACMFTY
jgi:hypothetical protein